MRMLLLGEGNVLQMKRFPMKPVLIVILVFFAGFAAGYTARA